jgi:hypothetical protein
MFTDAILKLPTSDDDKFQAFQKVRNTFAACRHCR